MLWIYSAAGYGAGAALESRAGILRHRLEALVADVSKWVRPVARHSLGPFLATLKSEDISEGLYLLLQSGAPFWHWIKSLEFL